MEYSYNDLKRISNNCRLNILEQVYLAKSGHIGGSLSCIDILVTIYFKHANLDINNPKWEDRDRIILSKGHCSPALYSVLAEKGFIEKELLKTFRNKHSILQGHPDMKNIPGVDMTSGSLGQGLSVANGIALAGKMDKKDYKVYCILGDGEVQEGQVWEAAMTSAHYKLNNIIAFLDYNNLQIDGKVEDVMSIENIVDKFKAFNFNVIEIDGHDFEQIDKAIILAKNQFEKPTIIIAKTIKGKGITFMENVAKWHGEAPKEEEYINAKNELELGGGN